MEGTSSFHGLCKKLGRPAPRWHAAAKFNSRFCSVAGVAAGGSGSAGKGESGGRSSAAIATTIVTSTIASMPLDVVKTQLQCSEASQPAADVLRGVLREMGWRGLWTGFIPRVLAAVPRSVCTVLAYERAIALCRT